MNTWNVTGKFIKDPEMSASVCRFCLSVANSALDDEKKPISSLFNFTAFGKMGETITKYFKKGSTIEVTASLRHNTYKNKQGVEVTSTEYIVEKIGFPPKSSVDSANNNEKSELKAQAKPVKTEPSKVESTETIDDEEFPF